MTSISDRKHSARLVRSEAWLGLRRRPVAFPGDRAYLPVAAEALLSFFMIGRLGGESMSIWRRALSLVVACVLPLVPARAEDKPPVRRHAGPQPGHGRRTRRHRRRAGLLPGAAEGRQPGTEGHHPLRLLQRRHRSDTRSVHGRCSASARRHCRAGLETQGDTRQAERRAGGCAHRQCQRRLQGRQGHAAPAPPVPGPEHHRARRRHCTHARRDRFQGLDGASI